MQDCYGKLFFFFLKCNAHTAQQEGFPRGFGQLIELKSCNYFQFFVTSAMNRRQAASTVARWLKILQNNSIGAVKNILPYGHQSWPKVAEKRPTNCVLLFLVFEMDQILKFSFPCPPPKKKKNIQKLRIFPDLAESLSRFGRETTMRPGNSGKHSEGQVKHAHPLLIIQLSGKIVGQPPSL